MFDTNTRELTFSLQTCTLSVELYELSWKSAREGPFTVKLKIESAQATTIHVTYTDNAHGVSDKLPISSEDNPVVLWPGTTYKITISSDTELKVWRHKKAANSPKHFALARF